MKKALVVALAVVLWTGVASAGSLTIDTFNDWIDASTPGPYTTNPSGIGGQGVTADGSPFPNPNDSLETGLSTSEVRGGRRQTTVTRDATYSSQNVKFAAGLLSGSNYSGDLSTDNNTMGTARLDYGVSAGGADLGDLADGGVNDRIVLDVLSADVLTDTHGNVATVTVSATEGGGGGGTATLTKNVPAGSYPQDMDFPFSDFTTTGAFSWGNVGGLSVLIQGAVSTDMSIDQITSESSVPEPATMALMGLAVVGLGGYIRRRRRA